MSPANYQRIDVRAGDPASPRLSQTCQIAKYALVVLSTFLISADAVTVSAPFHSTTSTINSASKIRIAPPPLPVVASYVLTSGHSHTRPITAAGRSVLSKPVGTARDTLLPASIYINMQAWTDLCDEGLKCLGMLAVSSSGPSSPRIVLAGFDIIQIVGEESLFRPVPHTTIDRVTAMTKDKAMQITRYLIQAFDKYSLSCSFDPPAIVNGILQTAAEMSDCHHTVTRRCYRVVQVGYC